MTHLTFVIININFHVTKSQKMFTEDMLDHNMKYNHTPPPITTYSLQHYYALRYIERGIAFVWMGSYDQC